MERLVLISWLISTYFLIYLLYIYNIFIYSINDLPIRPSVIFV
jgi:hypothetical protein